MNKTGITVALAGNPNSGKTTIFNALTGARQHVGNYPGVTVERKEGLARLGEAELKIVDLPGTYSLTAYSEEELLARNYLIDNRPDVVVNIVDASNLERNLYLSVQLMELGLPLVIVFNMSDMARSRGYSFDIGKLSRLLGARIVETVGHRGEGTDAILRAALEAASEGPSHAQRPVSYGREIEDELAQIVAVMRADGSADSRYDERWMALKLLESDRDLLSRSNSPGMRAQLERSAKQIESLTGDSPETAIASARYGFIAGACQECVRSTIEQRVSFSDRIDSLVTSRLLGIPLFLGMMYLVFQLTFTLGDPFMGFIEELFAWLGGAVDSLWAEGSQSALRSLLVDGVIGGVGGVLVFLPNILLLFLAIAVLEDSGYMARVAFIMDRLMNKMGLHGKSFIPMLIGFGCSVPAIMATRTLENRRDRLATMLVSPLMSCGARLPIYALIIPAFFPHSLHGTMLWVIYIIGILLAVLSAKLLRSTILRGESVPFVMELPPYRMPTPRGILIHMWERGWLYLRKAGTVILGISIILWAMTSYPVLPQERVAQFEQLRVELAGAGLEGAELAGSLASVDNLEAEAAIAHSVTGRLGHFIEPLLRPMGFDWKIGTAMLGAFAAKEVFVAQMGIVYSVGEADEESESLRDKLRAAYSPLVGFCIMLFCLISTPCMATIAVTRRESNSWGWALFQLFGLTALAWVVTVAVYQIGSLLGIGTI